LQVKVQLEAKVPHHQNHLKILPFRGQQVVGSHHHHLNRLMTRSHDLDLVQVQVQIELQVVLALPVWD
jgi:hypothetical protein